MNRIKKIIASSWSKGAFHIFTGSLLTRFVSFFASIFVVRILSKNDYGILSYYENIYNYFFLIAGYGLAYAVLRYVVIAKNINEKKAVFVYCQKKSLYFNFIVVFVGVIFAILYRHPIQFIDKRFFLILMLCFLPFQYMINICIRNERAFCDNKRFALVSFLYSLLLVLSKLLGAIFWNLTGALLLPLLIHFAYFVVLEFLDNKHYFTNADIMVLDTEKKHEIDIFSIQYMITNGLWVMFALNSTFILGRTIGNAELIADYKIATVVPSFISIISTSLGTYVGPLFTKHESEKDYSWVIKNWRYVMIVSFILIGFAIVFLFFFSPFIIRFVFGEKYSSSFKIMRLLLIATFFDAGFRYPTSNILSAMNKIKYNTIVSVVGIVTQLFFATFLSYKYGVIGIAISNIIVQFIMSLAINIFFVYFLKSKSIKIKQKGGGIEK